jgi:hypothetical protein
MKHYEPLSKLLDLRGPVPPHRTEHKVSTGPPKVRTMEGGEIQKSGKGDRSGPTEISVNPYRRLVAMMLPPSLALPC